MKRGWFVAALLLAGTPWLALAQDFGREARGRAEVVPKVVVGDAVDLRSADGRALLGLPGATPS